jgi:hypothetical protein
MPPLVETKPIFIIGAPRTGSTLLAQLLIDAFDLGTFTNRHSQVFGAPVFVERMFRPLKNRKKSDYYSEYGATTPPYGTSEGSAFWYRFFRSNPHYVTLDDVRTAKMKNFSSTVRSLSKLQKRPILFKNLYASLRLQPILKYLPESLFIVIQRDEVECALSILNARMDSHGSYEKWWSVPPPNVRELLKLPPEEQVIEQIRSVNSLVMADLKAGEADTRNFMTINYDSLCSDVSGELERVEEFLKNNGILTTRANDAVVPASFSRRTVFDNVDLKMKERVVRYAKN